jgi:error-prone DNA polymerase
VQDARRHGVKVLPVCVQLSDERCRVESDAAIRLGLASVHGVRAAAVKAMLDARRERPFASPEDFFRRTSFNPAERRALAGAGALNALAGHRRAALWHVEAVHAEDELFRHAAQDDEPALSPLERMTLLERLQADYAHLSLTTGAHPMKLMRPQLPEVRPAADLPHVQPGERIKIGGAVITRQRPGTAKGFCFITLEDETGLANAIVRPKLFEEARLVINLEPALVITGRVQNEQGVIHFMAEQIVAMPSPRLPAQRSHDYA